MTRLLQTLAAIEPNVAGCAAAVGGFATFWLFVAL